MTDLEIILNILKFRGFKPSHFALREGPESVLVGTCLSVREVDLMFDAKGALIMLASSEVKP